MQATLYLRVSTDRQEIGPEAQRKAAQKWAKANGVTILSEHSDIGVSGGAAIEDRPGLLAALDAVKAAGKGTLLLVAKRDRLARDVLNAAMIERLIERSGGAIVSADGTGNGDGPEAKLMRDLLSAFAAYERLLIGSRIKSALRHKITQGELVGSVRLGHVAMTSGRTRTTRDGAEKPVMVLAPDICEQAAIARAQALAGTHSLREIAAILTDEGYKPRGRYWHPQTISRMLEAGKEAS